MKDLFKILSTVVLLATLMVTLANCSKQDAETIEATKIALGVQTTLTAESAINSTVEAGIQATLNAMQVSLPPTETVTQPTVTPENDIEAMDETSIQATQTTMSASEPRSIISVEPAGPVTILSPADGAEVSRFNEVSGFVEKSALVGKFLNVIVTTRTGEHWVQTAPIRQDDGTWLSNPVYVGSASLGVGEEFTICAVIADQQLPVGQIYTYPDGPKACIKVTRVR